MVIEMSKPKSVHIYRGKSSGNLAVTEVALPENPGCWETPSVEYLGEYHKRGELINVRYEVRWYDEKTKAWCCISCPHRIAVNARLNTLREGTKNVKVFTITRRKVQK